MKLHFTWWLPALICGWPELAGAQARVLPAEDAQRVFAGAAQNISVTFSNPGDKNFDADIRIRVFQASSSTAAPLCDWYWKKLEVLPRQAILESASLDFPAVNAETKFLVQWMTDKNHVIGNTEVLVYPTNLLAELKPMAGDEGLGVFDPQNQLKPLLKNLGLSFTDLENPGLEHFAGRLAIVGPFDSMAQMRPGLAEQMKTLAKRDVAVVWLLPPEKRDKPVPSFYSHLENTHAAVVVQADQVSRLSENPQAQLNLIYFCKLALKPAPFALPDFSLQP
jgi:hypothetical protein